MLEVKIKYHDPEMPKIEFVGGDKSDWYDLRVAERVVMSKGEYKLLSLGVSMELPKGYEAHVAPRSSTFKNFGILLANSLGIIDNSYCGDSDIWRFPAIALRDTVIEKYERICQFRLVKKQDDVDFVEVAFLDGENRGGIGSTGTK